MKAMKTPRPATPLRCALIAVADAAAAPAYPPYFANLAWLRDIVQFGPV